MYFLLIPITGKAMRGSIIKGKPFIKKKKKKPKHETTC
jgi:hypothetical protein